MSALNYRRHFALLAGLVAVFVAGASWRPSDVVWSAALFGAAHATSLVVSLRTSSSAARRGAFVVLAAALAAASLWLTLQVGHLAQVPSRLRTPAGLLALCSGLGAMSYGALVRRFWIGKLSLGTVLALTLGCIGATGAVFHWLPSSRGLAGSWLAATWWWAFSLALYFFERRMESCDDATRPV
jgi:hypothetical protein